MQEDNSNILNNSQKEDHTNAQSSSLELKRTIENNSAKKQKNVPLYNRSQRWSGLTLGLLSIFVYFIVNQITMLTLVNILKIDLSKASIALTIPITGFTFILTAIIIASIVTLKDKPKENYFKKIAKLAKLDKFNWKHTLFGATLAPFVYIASITIATIATLAFPDAVAGANQTSSRLAETTGIAIIIALTFVTFLTPIIEEIFFRGVMLGTFQRYSQTKLWNILTILITGLIFGLLHSQGAPTNLANFMAVATPTLVGFITAWLTIKYKSLYPAIALHIVYNSVVTIAIFTLT